MDGLMAKKLSDTEIAQMFADYVTRMEEKERHTEAAVKEADAFDTYCESEFPRNVRLQIGLYDRMMNAAIEFEESGFIAGFKTAMALLSGHEELSPVPTQITTPKTETSQQEALNDSHDTKKSVNSPKDSRGDTTDQIIYAPEINPNFVDEPGIINTKKIADMFETTNFKVVRRIEKQILPYLDEITKKNFVRVEGHNIQHKRVVFYKLNKVACELYLKEVGQKRKNYINIAGGCAKMEELIEKVFPSEKVAIPA